MSAKLICSNINKEVQTEMRQLIKVLCVVLFGIICLSVIVKADNYTSFKAQEEFEKTVLDLLKSNSLEELRELTESIPDCQYLEDGTTPPLCTFNRTDGKDFITHVFQSAFRWDYKDFTVVNIDVAIQEGFDRLYSYLFRDYYTTLDVEKYRKFYDRFRGTWLAERAEQSMIRVWQKGDFLDKYSRFSFVNGRRLFTTIYVSDILGIGAFKYVSRGISMDLHLYNGGSGRVREILDEMKYQAQKLDALNLFQKVLHAWFYSIVSYEGWDDTEHEYYQDTKQERMYKYLDEAGWDMFGKVGMKSNAWERHTIKLNVFACRRVFSHRDVHDPEKICSAFEKGAEKYGFYYPPHVEPSIEKQIEEVQNQFKEKYMLAL